MTRAEKVGAFCSFMCTQHCIRLVRRTGNASGVSSLQVGKKAEICDPLTYNQSGPEAGADQARKNDPQALRRGWNHTV